MKFLLCILSLAMIGQAQAGSWGPSGCGPVGPMVAKQTGYEWRHLKGESQYSLYYNGRQVGGYDESADVFRKYNPDTKVWGPVEVPPWGKRQVAFQNFGLDLAQMSQDGKEHYSVNGKTQQTEGGIPDDSGKPFLVAIGSKEECQQISTDLASSPELAAFKDQVRFQQIAPDNLMLKDREGKPAFQVGGKPTIYFQAADGKVLHRQDGYDGPANLAAALRKATQPYEPAKDPDLRKIFAENPTWFYVLGGLIVFLLLKR